MKTPRFSPLRPRLLAAAAALLLGAGRADAQWASTPYQASQPVYQGSRLLVHDNGSGVQAFSASTGRWTTVSPTGSPILVHADGVLVTQEASGLLRAYSSRRNASALQAVTPGSFAQGNGDTVLVIDNVPAGVPILRAYSGYTNTWTSVTPATPYSFAHVSERVVGVAVGQDFYAYSALLGSWAVLAGTGTITSVVPSGNLVIAPLNGYSGPFTTRIAVFSAFTGSWSVAPLDLNPAAALQDYGTSVYACLTQAGPGLSRFEGYSAYTGQWTVSSTVHGPSSSLFTRSGENVIVVRDSDVAHRFEAFGVRNTAWQTLTGPNLDFAPGFAGVASDYGLAADSVTGTVYGFSALRPGGWSALNPGVGASADTNAGHLGIVSQSAPSPTYWAYLPALGAWSAPLAVNPGSVLTVGDSVANVYANSVDATHARFYALGAQAGTWVAGPLVSLTSNYLSLPGSSFILNLCDFGPEKGQCPVFDAPANAWGATYASALPVLQAAASGNQALVYLGGMVPTAYSARRGAWSSPVTAAGLASPVSLGRDLLWYFDSTNTLWAFGGLDDGQVWFDWPNGLDFQAPGPTSGAPPRLGYSIRGTPGVDVAFGFAGFGWSGGLAVSGVGGLAYLNPGTVLSLGSFGLVDADGMVEKQFSVPAPLPAPVFAWLQPVLIDTLAQTARFGGRAERAAFY